MSRRLLINASTCVVGGGVQVAVGFLHHLHSRLEGLGWETVVLASPAVHEQCAELPGRPGWRLVPISPSPASPLRGAVSRRAIRGLVAEFRPEACFTVFGPSYVRLGVPEFSGFADPSVTSPNRHYLRNHSFVGKMRTRLTAWIKVRALARVERFWVETETARQGLAARLGITEERIEVIPNVVNALFVPLPGDPAPGRVRFLHLSAYYPHKNHAFLLPVAKALRRLHPDLDFEFVVTLPEDGRPWADLRRSFHAAGHGDRIRTLGRLGVRECPSAYRDCHAVFHPSLLEVFSATYLEAFAARRPVVATDLDFAREACGDAALYFDPVSADAAARALHLSVTDPAVRRRLLEAGGRRIGGAMTAAEKNERLIRAAEEFMAARAR